MKNRKLWFLRVIFGLQADFFVPEAALFQPLGVPWAAIFSGTCFPSP
jgi:hypothetical protein